MLKTRSSGSSDKYYFDAAEASRAVDFFREYLTHVKGEWAGQRFNLEPWQEKQIVRPLFGWKRRADGTRRYRMAYIEVPKKNGKSTLSACIGLYLLFSDHEDGAEIYSAAADREQAAIVFDVASQMVKANAELRRRAQIYRRSIVYTERASTYKVLSADVPTKHGLNAHGVIFDELHVQKNRELWDVLTTATGARRQPLVVAITTAGYDRHSICWEQHEYARKVRDGIIEDGTFLPVVYAASEDEDWTAPKTWKKANPNFGVSVKPSYLEEQCKKAQESPAYENTFRRLHLNQWTKQESRWMPMAAWRACARGPSEADLIGRTCYSGLDLASTTDIAALVHVFPNEDGTFTALCRFWIPEDNMLSRSQRDRVPYDVWTRQGWIHATPGNVIDYGFIRHAIGEDAQKFDLKEVAFDRWGATKLIQELQAEGLTVIQFGQGFVSLSPPTKELLNLVLAKKLMSSHNPVLTWMADNVVVEQDAAGNIKPSKKKSTEKIDGITALVMALDRAVRHEGDEHSVYEDRGILTL